MNPKTKELLKLVEKFEVKAQGYAPEVHRPEAPAQPMIELDEPPMIELDGPKPVVPATPAPVKPVTPAPVKPVAPKPAVPAPSGRKNWWDTPMLDRERMTADPNYWKTPASTATPKSAKPKSAKSAKLNQMVDSFFNKYSEMTTPTQNWNVYFDGRVQGEVSGKNKEEAAIAACLKFFPGFTNPQLENGMTGLNNWFKCSSSDGKIKSFQLSIAAEGNS